MLDFRGVSMTDCAIRRKTVIELREMRALLRCTPCARDTGNRIDENRVCLYEMLLHERCQREDTCRRIAACIANEIRPSNRITV